MIDEIAESGEEALLDKEKVEETLPVDTEMSLAIKAKKVMEIDSTITSAAYVSLIKSNKKKYRLTQADQFDLIYRVMLIGSVQIFFIYCVLAISKINFVLYNNTAMQITLFFTTLLLHLGNLPLFRSGMYMMKFSLCHPE